MALPLENYVHHVSLLCPDIAASESFYTSLLGFEKIKRPRSFDFDGVWLRKGSISLHLIQPRDGQRWSRKHVNGGEVEIDSRSDHLSFISTVPLDTIEEILVSKGIRYERQWLKEGDVVVEQIFLHDPSHFLIEICNCDALSEAEDDSPRSIGTCQCRVDMRDVRDGGGFF